MHVTNHRLIIVAFHLFETACHFDEEVRIIQARATAAARGALLARSSDGSQHPYFESSKERIPVSIAEKRWLYDYFDSIGGEVKKGNYYR